ncbi:MAG: DUF2845 domain-containing protein [Desulfobacterales bacterium]
MVRTRLAFGKCSVVCTTVIMAVLAPALSIALDDAGSLRCDRESIMTGDTEFQVEAACGNPESVLIKGNAKKVWIYNFGPTRFIYYLTFVNGRLSRIQTGEYGGYHDDRIFD